MLDLALGLAIFFLKALIIVVAVIVIFSFLASLALRNKKEAGDKLKITDLGKKIKNDKNKILFKISSKKAQKKLKKECKKEEKQKQQSLKSRLFVLDFNGDIQASSGEQLKQAVTQILQIADPQKDRALVRLESPGGMVSGYGLAASELSRLRDQNIHLTVVVDKVAASGGYLMSCVANEILAAPFAIIGSIGVVAGMPNFHKLLKKNDIDYELLTAGKYKRTLTVLGENTEEGRQKFLEQLEQIHQLFKKFVSKYRPQLNMEEVATGEYWFGEEALEKKLIDGISTSEDYLLKSLKDYEIFRIEYEQPKKLGEKLMEQAKSLVFSQRGPFNLY